MHVLIGIGVMAAGTVAAFVGVALTELRSRRRPAADDGWERGYADDATETQVLALPRILNATDVYVSASPLLARSLRLDAGRHRDDAYADGAVGYRPRHGLVYGWDGQQHYDPRTQGIVRTTEVYAGMVEQLGHVLESVGPAEQTMTRTYQPTLDLEAVS